MYSFLSMYGIDALDTCVAFPMSRSLFSLPPSQNGRCETNFSSFLVLRGRRKKKNCDGDGLCCPSVDTTRVVPHTSLIAVPYNIFHPSVCPSIRMSMRFQKHKKWHEVLHTTTVNLFYLPTHSQSQSTHRSYFRLSFCPQVFAFSNLLLLLWRVEVEPTVTHQGRIRFCALILYFIEKLMENERLGI